MSGLNESRPPSPTEPRTQGLQPHCAARGEALRGLRLGSAPRRSPRPWQVVSGWVAVANSSATALRWWRRGQVLAGTRQEATSALSEQSGTLSGPVWSLGHPVGSTPWWKEMTVPRNRTYSGAHTRCTGWGDIPARWRIVPSYLEPQVTHIPFAPATEGRCSPKSVADKTCRGVE